MKKYQYLYNVSNGKILQSFSGDQTLGHLITSEKNILESETHYDLNNFYIFNDSFIEILPKPSENYVFDWDTKTWIQDYNLAANKVRASRSSLLINSDWTQTLNVPFSQQKQQEWATYRQQLRDITTQPGYPYNVVWPTPPSN